MSPTSRKRRSAKKTKQSQVPAKTVQYQSSGSSTDYDEDYVEKQDDDEDEENEKENAGGFEPTGENGDEEGGENENRYGKAKDIPVQ